MGEKFCILGFQPYEAGGTEQWACDFPPVYKFRYVFSDFRIGKGSASIFLQKVPLIDESEIRKIIDFDAGMSI